MMQTLMQIIEVLYDIMLVGVSLGVLGVIISSMKSLASKIRGKEYHSEEDIISALLILIGFYIVFISGMIAFAIWLMSLLMMIF